MCKRPVPETSGVSLAKRPCLESRTEAHQVAEGLLVAVSLPVSLTLGRTGAMGWHF